MQGDPLVSIRCLVYNHEPFLRQCLDGFVMQQTTFPFEAIIHDDASTDGSAAIIREYAEKYPDIIKPIYETENQWGKGTIDKIIEAAMHPNSKYIAHCEGDDYWTDPHKLQIQVDFLESHPDYYMTCHAFQFFYEDTKEFKPHKFLDKLPLSKYRGREYCTPSIDDFFISTWFAQILSIVRRKQDYISQSKRRRYGQFHDYIACYYMLRAGECAVFKDVMGVYRKHKEGIYSGRKLSVWADQALKNYYVLYDLEKEKQVLSICDGILSNIFISYFQSREYRESLNLLFRHFCNVPVCHFFVHSIKNVIKSVLSHYLYNQHEFD